jgi:hypothetical protein
MQIAGGAKSCGCFGAKVPMPPWLMLTIDSALLGLLLISKPWASLRRRGIPWAALIVFVATLAAVPWLVDRSAKLPPRPDPTLKPMVGDGATSQVSQRQTVDEPAKPAQASKTRSYVIFDPSTLKGKSVYDTDIAKLVDVDKGNLPLEGTWILYRWTCDHCAAHLKDMAASYDGSPLGLIRLRETTDTDENGVITLMPVGPAVVMAELPDTYDYVVTTPVVMRIEAGTIVSVDENPQH